MFDKLQLVVLRDKLKFVGLPPEESLSNLTQFVKSSRYTK